MPLDILTRAFGSLLTGGQVLNIVSEYSMEKLFSINPPKQ